MDLIGKRVQYTIPATGYGPPTTGEGLVLEVANVGYGQPADRVLVQDEATNQIIDVLATNCTEIEEHIDAS